jgi:putative ABC transport system permease protein
MTFATVVLRGLLRRPVRTGLTLLGIAVGIGAVVALVGMAQGFESSWAKGMNVRKTDIVISNMGSTLVPTPFDAGLRDRIARLPHVAATSCLLVQLMGIENASMMFVSAREWGGYEWENLKLLEGRLPHDAQERVVVLGKNAAQTLGKKVGDPIQIETEELTVAGIADGGALVEDGSVILSLPLLQEITGNEGRVNVIDVRVDASASEDDVKALCEEMNRLIPEASAVPAGDHIGNSQAYRFINAMSWSTSLLAVLAGVLGVMNTMLMAVLERRQEFAILLAIGWRPSRILRMVLCESALLGFLGGLAGMALGWLGARVLESAPSIHGLLEAELSPGLLAVAVVLATAVGVASGIYPAWRSARLHPGHALNT